MGLFKTKITDESVTMQTFQTIAQAIDVTAQTGMDKELGIKIGDLWALYFWTIKAQFENKPERLHPHFYELLLYSPGSWSSTSNTDTYQSPSQAIFPIDPDDYASFVTTTVEMKELLEGKYLKISTFNDRSWTDECVSLMDEVVREHLPTRYTNSSRDVMFVFSLALRSILKDTKSISTGTIKRLRQSGFFWIASMATHWHFKIDGHPAVSSEPK
jgi:hypothetical protein